MPENFWGGDHSHERGRTKIESVLKWLAYFDYSDSTLLSRMLGVQKQGQGAFFNRMIKEGSLHSIKMPAIRHRIFCLGKTGVDRAKVLLPEVYIGKPKINPSWVKIAHLFSIQAAIINRLHLLDNFLPEKAMSKMFHAKHVPDALLTYKNGNRVALEVELSHKAASRIYHIYLSHVKNIQNKGYDHVEYVFQNEGLSEMYQEKYDSETWPIYQRDQKKRRLVLQDREFTAKSNVQGLFDFKYEQLYDL